MIDLSVHCGFSVSYDEITGDIFLEDNCKFKDEHVNLRQLEPILLNKFLKYPEQVYRKLLNVCPADLNFDDNLAYNIYEIPNGLLGIEYIKTHIYKTEFKANKYACVIQVIQGQLTVLIQKNSDNEYSDMSVNKEVEDINVIEVEKGDIISIPTGVYYTFINTGNNKVIFAKLTIGEPITVDYASMVREKGLAIYIISKNARLEIVSNPKYRFRGNLIHGKFKELPQETKSKYINGFLESSINLFEARKSMSEQLTHVLA